MHALLTLGSTIDARIFPDDRAAVAHWLDAPIELLAPELEPDTTDEAGATDTTKLRITDQSLSSSADSTM